MVHVSSKIPASQGCCTWILPVAQHPSNPNAIICVDLSKDPQAILNENAETLRSLLYARQESFEEGQQRPGIKLIHINRSPFITTAKALTEDNADRLGLNRDQCLENYKRLAEDNAWRDTLIELYNEPHEDSEVDADHALYSGGFLTNEEKHWCDDVREAQPEQLSVLAERMQNPKLKTLLFRYRARNYPHTLTFEESQRWQQHRQFRLTAPDSPASITIDAYLLELEQLAMQHAENNEHKAILKALYDYAQNL